MSLAQKILVKKRAAAQVVRPLVQDRFSPQPLSAAQQRLWFMEQLDNVGVAYSVPVLYRLQGKLDIELLQQALNTIVARHEILRTLFVATDSAPKAQLVENLDVTIEHVVAADFDSALAKVSAQLKQPFDLATGPLLRVAIVAYQTDEMLLCINQHHIICDGWSITSLLSELSTCYHAYAAGFNPALPALPIQYMDYAMAAAEQDHSEGLDYWQKRLQDAPYLNLGAEAAAQNEAGFVSLQLPLDVSEGLNRLCLANNATLFMALLGFYQLFLSRYCGQTDVSVGVPVANRNGKDHDAVLGFFVNTLVMRQQINGTSSVNQLISDTRSLVLQDFDHQSVPFEKVVERLCPVRQTSETPLFNTLLVLQTTSDVAALQLPSVTCQWQGLAQQTPKFPLSLTLREGENGIEGGFEFRQGTFSYERVEQLAACFSQLIRSALANPNAAIDTLEWLPVDLQQQMLAMSTTAGCEVNGGIIEAFAEQVELHPNKIALRCGEQSLSYRELDARANQWAGLLQEQGVEFGERVGVAFHRNRGEAIECLLAILKLGAVYVPLDLSSPAERLAYIIEHTGIEHLLTSDNDMNVAANIHCDVDVSEYPTTTIHRPALAEQLGYVMYTSGTTGTPKGVMISHQSVLRLVKNIGYVNLSADDVMLQCAPLAFDAATFEIWGALLNGATLVMPSEPSFSLNHIGELLRRHDISIMWLTAQLFHAMVDLDIDAFANLRTLLAGGDVLSATRIKQLKQAYPALTIINGYGPTETTTFASCHTFSAADVEQGIVPIGRPIDNTRIYILDDNKALLPPMCEGEIYIAGAGVGLGYWQAPEQSAAAFLPDPFVADDDARMYRSGDIACFDMNGLIRYMGRRDGQVKLRGYRIELAEIRAALESIETVAQAEVMVRSEGDEKQLVAYYIGHNGALSAQALREILSEQLPPSMLPQYFVHLEQFPVTRNGKVDRLQLPAPRVSDAFEASEIALPANETEQRIADIWRQLLLLEQVGCDQNFFALGGHSLLTAQLQARLQKEFSVQVSIDAIFCHATVARQAQLVSDAKSEAALQIPRVEERQGWQPLSEAQERLWFLQQMAPQGTEYNVPMLFHLNGSLGIANLQSAIDALVERHEILRTVFIERNGQPWQQILANSAVPVVLHDCADDVEAQVLITNELKQAFDLTNGPLIRVNLFCVAADNHYLLLNQHHIICDGWSVNRLLQELSALYQGESLPSLELQYLDYTNFSRSQDHQVGLDWWQQQLAGAEPLQLPIQGEAQAGGSFYPFAIDAELSTALNENCRAQGATLFMALLGCYQVLLARLSGQRDISVGVPVANRPLESLEGVFGFFANTLVMRSKLPAELTFPELLEQSRNDLLAGFAHQAVPFAQVVERICPQRGQYQSPLFRTMLVLQSNSDVNALKLSGINSRWCKLPHYTAKFDLTLNLRETDQGIEGGFEYRNGLFDEAFIAQLSDVLMNLIRAGVGDSSVDLMQVDYLGETRKAQWLAQTQRGGAALETSLLHVFAEQVQLHGHKAALICADETLSYHELDAMANRTARYLQAQGVRGGDRVGLALSGFASIASTLAILKAGAVYVPLDLRQPAERLQYIIDHIGIEHVMSDVAELSVSAKLHDPSAAADYSSDAIAANGHHSDMCYIMHTSGTTGQPKGVMVGQSGILRLVRNTQYIDLSSHDVLLQSAPQAFDAATFEIWGALLNGASLVMPSETTFSLTHLSELLSRHPISVLWLTAQLFHAMVDIDASELAGLRLLLAGGDELSAERIKQLHAACPSVTLINGYGPTEVTTFSATHVFSKSDITTGRVSIGKAIDHTNIYVLDDNLNPVAPLVAGEMYIGGAGVAKGYWNDETLSAAAFIKDPFAAGHDAKMYRSGDLACYELDGTLTFLGRRDGQVKIRGFRIELAEIKRAMERLEGVNQAEILVNTSADDKQVVAYFTGDQGLTPADLRHTLAKQLPDYMVPRFFVGIKAFDVTSNGKIDRRRLPTVQAQHSSESVAKRLPQTAMEKSIAAIWQTLLSLDSVGVDDNFFALGGHSLMSARLQARLQDIFAVKLAMADIFANPTIASQQQLIKDADPKQLLTIEPVAKRDVALPLSSAQRRLYLLATMNPASVEYNVPVVYQIGGELRVDVLQRAVDILVARHEILRTRFLQIEGEPMQQVQSAANVTVELKNGDTEQLLSHALAQPFDLSQSPLLSVQVLRGERQLLFINQHHIICDGWSVNQLLDELVALYNAEFNGREAPLAPVALQYIDYAQWANQQEQQQGLDYWSEILQGAERLALPSEGPAQAGGGYYSFTIDHQTQERLGQLCSQTETTAFMVLLGLYQVLLSRYSGQHDISVGTVVANREHQAFEDVLGFFVNTLVMRQQLPSSLSVKALLDSTKSMVLEGFAHQAVPFEQVVDALCPTRELGQTPLFNTLFAFQNFGEPGQLAFEGLSAERLEPSLNNAKFDLTLTLRETEQGLVGGFEYRRGLFSENRIAQMAQCYGALLDIALADVDCDILACDYVPTELRQPLVSIQPSTDTIVSRFDEVMKQNADKTALRCGLADYSYRQLDALANQWANLMLSHGVKPGDSVVLAIDSDERFVAAALAALKCGAAYLPIDINAPEARIGQILTDSKPSLVVAEQGFLLSAANRIDWQDVSGYSAQLPFVAMSAGSPAYIIYTSGSTGTPKGVVNSHQGVVNLVDANSIFTADDVMAQLNNVSFDAAVWEIWTALLKGGTVVSVSKAQLLEPTVFSGVVEQYQINIALFTTALFNIFATEHPQVLALFKAVYFGGEAADLQAIRRLPSTMKPRFLINAYGPSENAVITSEFLIDELAEDATRISIGRAIAGCQVYIVDANDNCVPPGVVGELCIGGAGVALGYLNQPEMTAQSYVINPFDTNCGHMYRSGDLAFFDNAGLLHYAGRADRQVKIRGHRVELAEIAAALVDLVDGAMVHVEYFKSNQALVGYIVNGNTDIDGNELRRCLLQRLADYMVPDHIVAIDALPLTGNGKVDSSKLPLPQFQSLERVMPRDATEQQVWQGFAAVLGSNGFGIDDSFFDLGGNSLLAIKLATKLRKALDTQVALSVIFEAGTVSGIASQIAAKSTISLPAPLTLLKQGGEQYCFAIHPLGGESACYLPLAAQLDSDFSVIGIDHPSFHGGTTPSSIEQLAEVYAAAIRAVQLQGPYFLLGWSLGGLIAIELSKLLGGDCRLALLDSFNPQALETLDLIGLAEGSEVEKVNKKAFADYRPERNENAALLVRPRQNVIELLREDDGCNGLTEVFGEQLATVICGHSHQDMVSGEYAAIIAQHIQSFWRATPQERSQ
ncbi:MULTISPECIES: non-ribosomal peptide synthetase [Idiomarina]|nr:MULTISPECIES: non-ribosomal peptide synthetase [Idiomarina]